jgi:hypothetical protein
MDDDKVFGQNDPKKDMYGIRYTKHIKDNRNGYYCHCTATTCTLCQIANNWEQQGESTHICREFYLEACYKIALAGTVISVT